MAELGGLGVVSAAMQDKGGRLLAVAIEPVESLRTLVHEEGLPFRVSSDADGTVARAYGLLHEGGGPGGTDIAVPAHVLIHRNGLIVWRYAAPKIHERADPDAVLTAISRLP